MLLEEMTQFCNLLQGDVITFTVSHNHLDHSNVSAIKGNPVVVKGAAEIKGIKFRGVSA